MIRQGTKVISVPLLLILNDNAKIHPENRPCLPSDDTRAGASLAGIGAAL